MSEDNSIVYLPDIPMDIPENKLNDLIKTRVETAQSIKIKHIKTYLSIGITVIELLNEDDKARLVSKVESMVLDKKKNITISFVDQLDFQSFIVLKQNLNEIPSNEEITRRFKQIYIVKELDQCESISDQFPNIFRISLKTIDELVRITQEPDFRVGDDFAVVFPYADCSIFEGLPPNINEDKISAAIRQQINETDLSATSFFIQVNKETQNAIVISKNSNRKWIAENSLKINGKELQKKKQLAFRVIVSPVPQGFEIDLILKHILFNNKVIKHTLINDKLYLELDNLESYKHCLENGGLGINNNLMKISTPSAVTDPENHQINSENWYETEMTQIKADIMTMIDNHQHPIFHYQWNSQNWLEQMKKAEIGDRKAKKYDLDRHLLRVTVMLNTIGVLRKKFYCINEEKIDLNLERMKTIRYDHQSKLDYGKTVNEKDLKTPFPSTTVHVINEDCLVLYEKLVSEGYKPMLLNMANATNPGGGYRKGDGAQEENLFRRSDYYHSLDLEIADKDRSEPFRCTETCEIKRMKGYAGLYPMEDFGAIYTSGITVFRQTEENGYAFMKKPLSNVCSIAIAAYRDPKINKNNLLENKFAVKTHRKIENIFSVGYHHQHDSLVLSAFGCGAFKNPPQHVASLFKSVIYQYAGFFKAIYFAIIDDHNTGNVMNPQGNFVPFEKVLNDLTVYPAKTFRNNGVFGPHRILSKTVDGKIQLSDACISSLPPCQYGASCKEIKDSQHCSAYLHPPMCSYQNENSPCDQMIDDVHTFFFEHTSKCKFGGQCHEQNPNHFIEYEHPEYCPDKHCIDLTPEHLFEYRHLPICKDGIDCVKNLKDEDHRKSFRHCRLICQFDNCCALFHDKTHLEKTIHSFRTPCPFTPYSCSLYIEFIQTEDKNKIRPNVEEHCLRFSHVCPFGRQCKKKDNRHFETSIHIARQICQYDEHCSKINEENHLESLSHSNIRDIRLLCREPGYKCSGRYKDAHLTKYRHGQNYDHLSVIPSSNLNAHVNFAQNQGQLIRTVNNFVDRENWKKAKVSSDIVQWVKALQPVHRCASHIFESILVHGHVMSRRYMHLLKQPKYVAKAVQQHSRIQRILRQHNILASEIRVSELISVIVEAEFAKKTGPVDTDNPTKMKAIKNQLIPPLDNNDIATIREWAIKIAQASIKLHESPMGIGYHVDETLGTDKHVFSILGFHRGTYYGDIVITFKQEIMFHPDSNFSIQAGTTFGPSGNAYKHRPWLRDPGDSNERVKQFHCSKLHCCVPKYEYAAAMELIALTGLNKKSMDVDLNEIIQRWNNVDSHEVFESHLPQLIPLDYIDSVFIPKNMFQSLSSEAQHSAKAVFKDSLVIVNQDIDLSLIVPGKLVPFDATRKRYLDFILDKLSNKINERIKNPRISRGIVITVSASGFKEQIILPMSISQSYRLYLLDNPQTSQDPENTYIYWQIMNGDMMLTVASDQIDLHKQQNNIRCLVCYVAEKPSTATEDYHENYSYINDGSPFQHENNVQAGTLKAKSNIFYRGCNTDDFLTFCLRINHKTGQVTLIHAGPNSIYNYEMIEYQFDKATLDLSRIDYVHVSAGKQDVPVRNLTISHQRIESFHPSIDKEFKNETTELLKNRRSSLFYSGYVGSNALPKEINDTNRTNILQKKRQNNEQMSILERFCRVFCCSRSTVESSIINSPNPVTKKMPLCRDSIYCLKQNDKDHTNQYSHLCRFNDLCRNKHIEFQLIHQEHRVPQCSDDEHCTKRIDPIHRAQFRHKGLSDFLYPCRFQEACYDRSENHRMKYFHGEQIPNFKKTSSSSNSSSVAATDKARLYPCKYGKQCRSMRDPNHIAKYSHPT